jgi:hypothetical protein
MTIYKYLKFTKFIRLSSSNVNKLFERSILFRYGASNLDKYGNPFLVISALAKYSYFNDGNIQLDRIDNPSSPINV